MIKRSFEEERVNAATHLLGAVLALVGLAWMVVRLSADWQSTSGIACVVYAFLLVLVYAMSTLSHWFDAKKTWSDTGHLIRQASFC